MFLITGSAKSMSIFINMSLDSLIDKDFLSRIFKPPRSGSKYPVCKGTHTNLGQLDNGSFVSFSFKNFFTTKKNPPWRDTVPWCEAEGWTAGGVPLFKPLPYCNSEVGLIGIGQPSGLRSSFKILAINLRSNLISLLFINRKTLFTTTKTNPIPSCGNNRELIAIACLFRGMFWRSLARNSGFGLIGIGRTLGMRSLFYKNYYEPSTGGFA
jgi:hypothetical protein